jgi:subtilisin family serine protease
VALCHAHGQTLLLVERSMELYGHHNVCPSTVNLIDAVTASGSPSDQARLPLDLVQLGPLMRLGPGRPQITVGLIDGPVAVGHPGLACENIRALAGGPAGCEVPHGAACFHGTFVAGILSARRGGAAPALCPGCRLVARPIFSESALSGRLPTANPDELAAAIVECIDAGADVLNISASLARASAREERALRGVLDHACRRGVAVVAASGNQSAIGGSAITRHPWVVPAVGYSLRGRPLSGSNLGAVIGRQGLGAPGENVTSLSARGGVATSSGTSVAAPFVTGTFALLLSAFPHAHASEVRAALVRSAPARRTVVPPLLDAWAAYRALRAAQQRR